MGTRTIAEVFADWLSQLSYERLPEHVADKAKACLLHNLVTGLVGAATPLGRATTEFISIEEARQDGASILGSGSKVTRAGAAFANSVLINITNQCDSYRMLTHPGPCIVPAVLATAELEDTTGAELLTGLVGGYEVQSRLAHDWIPTTQARGFRSAPIYGGVGAAAGSAHLRGLGRDGILGSIGLAATSAAGTSECARVGTNEHQFHEPIASRNAVLASTFSPLLGEISASSLDGEAGFMAAFAGGRRVTATHHFVKGDPADLERVVTGLGDDYYMLNVTFKPYPTPGFNNPVIELVKRMRNQHHIEPSAVDTVVVELNHLETTYPSPEFPRRELQEHRVGTTPYVVAQTLANGEYSRHGQWFEHGLGKGQAGEREASPEVVRLMGAVRSESSDLRAQFSPRIRILLTTGEELVDEMSGDEFKWDFETTASRALELADQADVASDMADALVDSIRHLDQASSVGSLIDATTRGVW